MQPSRFRLYDQAGLQPVFRRMARQTLAVADGRSIALVGVLRRGAPLADLLAQHLHALQPELALTRTDLKVKRYSDDLHLLHPDTSLTPTPEQAASRFPGQVVVVVDDVLYQGHSLQRVFEFLRDREAHSVHAAVLVDRCAQRVPVHADIVGATVQIAPDDVIECNVPPFEPELAVDIWRPAAEPTAA